MSTVFSPARLEFLDDLKAFRHQEESEEGCVRTQKDERDRESCERDREFRMG